MLMRCCASRQPQRVAAYTKQVSQVPNNIFVFNWLELAQELPSPASHFRRLAVFQFATLVITTMFATATAVALQWLFLQAAYVMMQPATARRLSAHTQLVRSTAQLARAFVSNR